MGDETIHGTSNLGKRLEKIKRKESRFVTFQGKKIPITAKIRIGRSEASDIVIDDNMTSRNHAEIQKIKDAYFIKDLNSTNGTCINDVKVPKDKYIRLNLNDVIKIGRTELKIK